MTALAIALATIAAGALALAAVAVVSALRNAGKLGDARVRAAEAEAESTAAAIEVARSIDALDAMDRARQRQQDRADTLEAEIHELEANPVALVDPAARAGRGILRDALRRAAGVVTIGAGGHDPVPDAAAAEPAASPGD